MQRRVEEVDAFKAFFDYFHDKKITPQAFYQFGMESSVFADKVNDEYAA